MDIFDFSDFFDFQADVPPEINDLRNPGFGLWFALSSSKGKRTGSRAWAHWKGEASCWVNQIALQGGSLHYLANPCSESLKKNLYSIRQASCWHQLSQLEPSQLLLHTGPWHDR